MKSMSSQGFGRGERYMIVKDGGNLRGCRAIVPGAETLWRKDFRVGDIITCAGGAFTTDDGVPIIHWLGADGVPLANASEFVLAEQWMDMGILLEKRFLARIDSCSRY